MLTVLASCSKEMFSGSEEYSSYPGEGYMLILSQRLLPDYLIALESALVYDSYGYPSNTDYQTGDVSLNTQGAVWTVNGKKAVKGIKITCIDNGVWKLEREGEYYFYDSYYKSQDNDGYPTQCTVIATQLESVNSAGHYNWKVTFTGSRTEREGYACTFKSEPDLTYTSTADLSNSWSGCEGSATMYITKNGEKVDFIRMDYFGASTRYFGGM